MGKSKKKWGCLWLPLLLVVTSFRIGFLNEYSASFVSQPSENVEVEVRLAKDIDRYPFVATVGNPIYMGMSVVLWREINDVKVTKLEVLDGTDKDIFFNARQNHEITFGKHGNRVFIDFRAVYLPRNDFTYLLEFFADTPEDTVSYSITVNMKHDLKLDFGNHFHDHIMGI